MLTSLLSLLLLLIPNVWCATFRIVDDEKLQEVMAELQQADVNRAGSNDTIFNYQSHVSKGKATEKFIPFISKQYLQKPTIKTFLALMSEFDPNVGRVDKGDVSRQLKVDQFLDAVLDTDVMRLARNFFQTIGHPAGRSEPAFRAWLKQVWFRVYDRRRGSLDSSAFEHVFLGELSGKEVAGLHNWIRFAYLESLGAIDYNGFILERQDSSATLRYSWNGRTKTIGTMLLGASPELEMAIFSICYVERPEGKPCRFYYKSCEVIVNTFEIQRRAERYLSTAFPKAGQTCRLPKRNEARPLPKSATKLKQD